MRWTQKNLLRMKMWKRIPDYPRYLVSGEGDVYSERTGKVLKPAISKFGYARVALYKGNGEVHTIMDTDLWLLRFWKTRITCHR